MNDSNSPGTNVHHSHPPSGMVWLLVIVLVFLTFAMFHTLWINRLVSDHVADPELHYSKFHQVEGRLDLIESKLGLGENK